MSKPPASGVKSFEMTLQRDGVDHKIKFVFDLSLQSHQNIYSCLGKNRLYEAGTSRVLMETLRAGDLFIDVGAHIGYFSMLASRLVGPGGRVISLEPEPHNYEALLTHLKLNAIENVLPLPWAASSSVGVTELFTDPANDGGHAVWNIARRMKEADRPGVTCRPTFATTLDALAASFGASQIKAVKIDVEGFELEVLKGMQKLMPAVPIVIVEINRSVLTHLNVNERDIRQLMSKHGYAVYIDEPETGQLLPLKPGQEYQTNYVFNLIFARPDLALSALPQP